MSAGSFLKTHFIRSMDLGFIYFYNLSRLVEICLCGLDKASGNSTVHTFILRLFTSLVDQETGLSQTDFLCVYFPLLWLTLFFKWIWYPFFWLRLTIYLHIAFFNDLGDLGFHKSSAELPADHKSAQFVRRHIRTCEINKNHSTAFSDLLQFAAHIHNHSEVKYNHSCVPIWGLLYLDASFEGWLLHSSNAAFLSRVTKHPTGESLMSIYPEILCTLVMEAIKTEPLLNLSVAFQVCSTANITTIRTTGLKLQVFVGKNNVHVVIVARWQELWFVSFVSFVVVGTP